MQLNQEASLLFQLERMRTPCGDMLLATDDEEILCALLWEINEEGMRRALGRSYRDPNVRVEVRRSASDAGRALEEYLAGDLHAIDTIPVRMHGTPFQREVWQALRAIPVGKTTSYGVLAAQLRRPSGMRAVGLANGSNPIAVVVPCHRVIGADGSLTGYGGGLERKRWLLEHEGVDLSKLRRAGPERSADRQLNLGLAPPVGPGNG